jgi:hypothetical protein
LTTGRIIFTTAGDEAYDAFVRSSVKELAVAKMMPSHKMK